MMTDNNNEGFNPRISYYTGSSDTTSRQIWNIEYMLDNIRNGYNSLDKKINRLRETADKETRDRLKRYLPAVTVAGTFSYRDDRSLLELTPFVCLDFDHLDNPAAMKSNLALNPNVYAAFISPSGCGVKAIILTDNSDPAQYRMKYNELMSVFSSSGKPDSSCQNLSRLTYLSYDPDLYHNPDATPYHYEPKVNREAIKSKGMIDQGRTVRLSTPELSKASGFLNLISEQTGDGMTDRQIINFKEKQWRNEEFYREGNRQTSLIRQASALCSYGVDLEAALKYLLFRFGKAGLGEDEIMTKVCYCYRTTIFGNRRWEVIRERDKGRQRARQHYSSLL